jgi:hypothetical protein
MNPIIRNILAIILGWASGSLVNMGLIQTGHKIYPIEGLDPNDMDALANIMPTLSYEYFIFPFLAHALGTLVGGIVAYKIAAIYKMKFALVIGVLFFIGGVLVNYLIPGPKWFAATDILVAYIPMAWIGGKIGEKWERRI